MNQAGIHHSDQPPDADTLMNSAEGLEYAESGVLNEVCPASHQEEIPVQNLRERGTEMTKGWQGESVMVGGRERGREG